MQNSRDRVVYSTNEEIELEFNNGKRKIVKYFDIGELFIRVIEHDHLITYFFKDLKHIKKMRTISEAKL